MRHALLLAGAAEAQWHYTDDSGVVRFRQWQADVPEKYRGSAVWGPLPVAPEDAARWAERQRAGNAADALRQQLRDAESDSRMQNAMEEVRERDKRRRAFERACLGGDPSPTCAGYFNKMGEDAYRYLNR